MADYEVGYGRPPKAGQFAPGRSGNPRGRAKGSQSLTALLDKISNERVTVNEGGTTVKLSKREVVLRQLINKAMKGDLRALETLLDKIHATELASTERQLRSALALTPEQQGSLRARLRLQIATLLPEPQSEPGLAAAEPEGRRLG